MPTNPNPGLYANGTASIDATGELVIPAGCAQWWLQFRSGSPVAVLYGRGDGVTDDTLDFDHGVLLDASQPVQSESGEGRRQQAVYCICNTATTATVSFRYRK